MGCAYLVVKGLGIVAQPERRNAFGWSAAVLAWIAAPIFYLIAETQLASNALDGSSYGATADNVMLDDSDLNMSLDETENAAQRALENADRAIANANAALQNAQNAVE